jgi:lipid II:glycine glycyltransferase (peptidoglycan interpeptide bridge formation enzyme)
LDEKYKDCFPSAVATWAAIEMGSELNCRFFDFMGAGSATEEYGVREFKARFGGSEVEPGRLLMICNPKLFSLGKLALKIYASLKK